MLSLGAGERVVYIGLRSACNASCPMCVTRLHNVTIPEAVTKALLPLLREDGWTRLVLTGGEFVHCSYALSLLREAADVGFRLGAITNGTVFEPRYRDYLDIAALDYIVYSRDFADEDSHARYRGLLPLDAAVTTAFRKMRSRPAWIQVNTVLLPDNCVSLELFSLLPFWPDVDEWHIIPVRGTTASRWTRDGRDEAARILRRIEADSKESKPLVVSPLLSGFDVVPLESICAGHYTKDYLSMRSCGAERHLLYIDPWGEVLPCNSVLWPQSRRVSLGNILTEKGSVILDRKRDWLNRPKLGSHEACRACDPFNVLQNRNMGADVSFRPQRLRTSDE